ncbi:MAG: sensor histidine kinase [Bacteroidetes bacterium]|nr:sensor histidine kinase [Bacteroidota bacterium]
MERKIKKHSFEPGAMSIIQMGEELIGHPTTAINELVKNGYDADATEVLVYVNVNPVNSFALIFDNGLGMESKTLFGDWLKPSISSKRKKGAKSEIFERSYLGSKGIGRLASMALGRHVTVITKRAHEKEYNWLTLDSFAFKGDKLLRQIKFPGDQIDNYSKLFIDPDLLRLRSTTRNQDAIDLMASKKIGKFKEGTLIIVENVDDSVKSLFQRDFEDQNELEDATTIANTDIYKALSILITPLKLDNEIQKELLKEKIVGDKRAISKDNSTFDIFFGSNYIPSEERYLFLPVRPISIMEKYDYRAIGKVTKEGNIIGKYSCNRLAEFAYSEDFIITNEIVFSKDFKKTKGTKKPDELTDIEWNADTGEFYFDIRVYDRGEEDSREKLYSLVEANSVDAKRKLIDNLLGLRISKNGFGVKPYGEEVKDWLDLSQIRVQNPGQSISINQFLGYVFFYSPENDGLKEKTNREGFYENKAFVETKNIIQVIVKNIGQLRYNFRLRHNLGRTIKNKLQRPNVEKFLDFVKTASDQETVIKRSEEFVKEITTALDTMEDTLSFSQRLASLGTGLELIYHELSQPVAKIGGSRAILKQKTGKISDVELRGLFIEELSHIGSYVAELDELKTSLKPAVGKSRQQIFKPINLFKKVCYLFRRDIADDNIEILFQKEAENFEINDFEYALWISFLNILNNAVYWLRINKDEKKYISFSLEGNSIIIANNSPLIPEEYIDMIFEYGVTLKKEKNATGLGLAFTKNILNLNNWTIVAENRKEGPAFIITKRT